jgi:hypothetical protein
VEAILLLSAGDMKKTKNWCENELESNQKFGFTLVLGDEDSKMNG